ncbi:hypothetical protein ACN47E_002158 [Coniothyrium glycines]
MSAAWTNYSVGTASHAGDEDGPVSMVDDVPACVSCKKRKLRCSREVPTCSHCLRLSSECVYQAKQKPGLKPGAVEALARRVAFLEQILLDEKGSVRSQYSLDHAQPKLQQLNSGRRESAHHGDASTPAQHCDNGDGQQRPLSPVEATSESQGPAMDLRTSVKRKFEPSLTPDWPYSAEMLDISRHLPAQVVLEKVADFFCISFHHWIPYIHKKRLQTRVREGRRGTEHDLVLHALVAVVLRHMEADVIYMEADEVDQQCKTSRMIVETHALRNVSIESLQAIILLVFEHLNDGEPQRAWPLIGSLTRTIDYLQLTTEPASAHAGSLMTPIRLVRPSTDWTELEERRRLFWVIFLLDRFCSYTTGWNTSLTADDVHRRLPADGGYFTREEPVTTPYFGLWNKAAARIGRSLANVPAHYNEDDPAVEAPQGQGTSPTSANGYIDASKLGAFAYCVEATESLSQVTTFFLQQRINWQDKEHAISWLTRFKELDLRLVHWKIFLPTRWKDSNISVDKSIVDMDPNLTLAHITHNTSMILLHHPIAYPPKALWNEYVALPKDCSAQTCALAAVETSNIVNKFLAHTLIPFVNVQFAFCAFIAAKALLFEHQVLRRPLRQEFQHLIRDLWNMSIRWYGKREQDGSDKVIRPQNQPGYYASHLERLLEACQQDSLFRFDFYDHSGFSLTAHLSMSPEPICRTDQRAASVVFQRPRMMSHARQNSFTGSQVVMSPAQSTTITHVAATAPSPSAYESQHAHLSSTQLLTPMDVAPIFSDRQASLTYTTQRQPQRQPLYQMSAGGTNAPMPSGPAYQVTNGLGTHQSVQDQSLLNLSDAFMDSHFLDMDRVITFEDANFVLPGDTFRWQ